jgi:hypothetical protein
VPEPILGEEVLEAYYRLACRVEPWISGWRSRPCEGVWGMLERNYALAASYYSCTGDAQGRPLYCHAGGGPVDRAAGILYPVLLPRGAAVWSHYYPDHCPGTTVFYAGLKAERLLDGTVLWRPFIAISCSHFEHGDDMRELAGFTVLRQFIEYEAFDLGKACHVDGLVRILDPYAERLIAEVGPATCTTRGIENGGYPRYCGLATPREAVRLFSCGVRRQLRALALQSTRQDIPWSILGVTG